jgi:hypothetical protein
MSESKKMPAKKKQPEEILKKNNRKRPQHAK